MTARAWEEDLLDDYAVTDVDAPEDPSWDDASDLLWDEHLARQEARVADEAS